MGSPFLKSPWIDSNNTRPSSPPKSVTIKRRVSMPLWGDNCPLSNMTTSPSPERRRRFSVPDASLHVARMSPTDVTVKQLYLSETSSTKELQSSFKRRKKALLPKLDFNFDHLAGEFSRVFSLSLLFFSFPSLFLYYLFFSAHALTTIPTSIHFISLLSVSPHFNSVPTLRVDVVYNIL